MSAGLPDRYAVVEHIGADSCFESFNVIDRADGRIKLLHTAPVALGKTAALTKMAASLPERTHHNCVCVVLDTGCGKTHSMVWLVTEFVAGAVALDDLLADTTLHVDEALTIAADVASGLSYVRAHEIPHSNVPLSDVLVWHQPGHGVRAKVDRLWVPYLASEIAADQTCKIDATAAPGSGTTTAGAFRRVWDALCVRTRTSVAEKAQAEAFRCATELTHSGADIETIADLFLRLVRTDIGPKLVPAETASNLDIDAVLSLDQATLEREYRAAARSESSPVHVVREIASRVFVQNTGVLTDVLRSAMVASVEETMPEQLSLLDVGEDASAGPKLLLVDAEEDRSSQYAHIFQAEGFVVDIESSPLKAVELVNETRFDAAAVWLSASDATQDGAVRELLRCNNICPVLPVFPSTDAADVMRVLARITRSEVHRRHKKRVNRAELASADLPFCSTPMPRALDG